MRDGKDAPLAAERDGAPLALLLLAALVVSLLTLDGVGSYIRGDWPTAFLPWYSELGRRLRSFDIPGWNPFQFSGTPFIGDPSSGWMYFLAMASYTTLPPLAATTTFILLHVLLAAAAAYLLARLTGLGPPGALVAGFAFTFPWLLPASAGMVLMFQVITWIPISLIGVELARGPGTALRRLGGLTLSGLAISQILASWLGQGSYYALLIIGGWVAWRTLISPPNGWSVPRRLAGLLGIGSAILAIGFALNAAALLVRLDANSRSNAAGGSYSGISGWADTKAGIPLTQIVRAIGGGYGDSNWQYVGIAVIALALIAPILATRWPPLFFWILTSVTAILLALPGRNLVQEIAFVLLPRFEVLHTHMPERSLQFLPLPAAMLAGATVDALSWGLPRPRWRSFLLVLGVVGIAAATFALERQEIVTRDALLVTLAALAVTLSAVALPRNVLPFLLPLAIAVIIVWDPALRVLVAGWGQGEGTQRSLSAAFSDPAELDAFLTQNGAASFLNEATRDAPGRYAGYDPAYLPDIAASGPLPPQAYRNHWLSPANWLLVQNWGTWFQVEDVQGYNPITIRRYGEYIDALNGHRQEYHETDIFPSGLTSPLVDPLNIRFLIVPASAPGWSDFNLLLAALPTVYNDDHVRILEHPGAQSRAWLVHQAQQVAPEEILPLLATGTVDSADVALLETVPPPLESASPGAVESATYIRLSPDHFRVTVETTAPALLSLSEIWDPGWRATVDGAPATIYRLNYIFQGLAIPAGSHVVDVRYEPPYLGLGMGISSGTVIILSLLAATLYRRERRGTSALASEPLPLGTMGEPERSGRKP